MTEKDEFFLPEDIDRQIEAVKQSKEGDQRDAEALVYLSSYYQADALPQQEALDRIGTALAMLLFCNKIFKKVGKNNQCKIHKVILLSKWVPCVEHAHRAILLFIDSIHWLRQFC